MQRQAGLLFAALLTGIIVAPAARAQGSDGGLFAPPVRLKAGDKWMGEGRLFPSPVFRDMNGDGLLDVVIGDLPGRLTVALRLPGDGTPCFGPETRLQGADGKELRFHNW